MKENAQWAVMLLLACGTAESPSARDAGARDTGTPDAGICLLDIPTGTRVREGAVFDPGVEELGGSAVQIAWPDGFVVVEQGVRAPYGALGPVEAPVRADCGAQGTLRLGIAPITYEVLPAWADGDGPDAREHPMMWIDPADSDRLFVFGGFSFTPRQFTVVADLWSYDLVQNVWASRATDGAPQLAAGRLAIGADGLALYDGGSDQNTGVPFSLVALDTTSDPATWAAFAPTGAPNTGAYLHGFVYDTRRDRYLSIGGFRNGPSSDVYRYDSSANTYTWITPAGDAPSARYGYFVAYDEPGDRIVLFGGAQNPAAGNSVNPAHDTWALELGEEPPRWAKLFDETQSPPGRRNGCSAMDTKNHRFFVWGGTPDARTTEFGLWVLDLDRGSERWTRLLPELDGVVRSSCSGTYDPARERVLFGFGNNSVAIYADLVAVQLD